MLNHRRAIHFAASVAAIACLALTVDAASASAPRGAIVGDTPRLMRGTLALGNVAPSMNLRLTVVLTPRDPSALAAFATAVSTPGSPEYHHYLTVRQFAARFGASRRSIAALRSTLRRSGLRPGALAPDALSLGVSGTAARVSRAFSVTLRRYREPGGASVYANTAAPTVPAGLRNVVRDVLGLSNLPVAAPTSLIRGPRRTNAILPQLCPGGSAGGPYTINQIANAYGMTGLQTVAHGGAGVTIGLFELESYAGQASDWSNYTRCFGSSNTSITNVIVPPGPNASGNGETALDLDVVAGLAPASNIKIFQGENSPSGSLATLQAIVDDPSVSVISDSWGLCELDSSLIADEQPLLQQAATEHQSVFVAAGDTGAYGCTPDTNSPNVNSIAVDDPASQPFATGVGGTSLDTSTSPSETAWNDTGGGVSSTWSIPSYQASYGVAGSHREVPDVAADADPNTGYIIYFTPPGMACSLTATCWYEYGGTSAAAPLWAALTALADASNVGNCSPSSPLGFLNPSLYSVAAGSGYGSTFNDPTTGNNGVYSASTGYDMTTGLGTPIGAALVGKLCNAPAGFGTPPVVTAVSPTDANPGSTVTITGTAFTSPATVAFGSVPASNVTVVDSGHITATVPAGSSAVGVAVTTPFGTSPASSNALFTYGPVASVVSPAAGATYTQGQLVLANYSCLAWTGASPSCAGPVPSTAPINTATLGAHQFPVSATDSRGVTSAVSVPYTVIAPPHVTVTTPAANATYYRGQKATVSFSCATSAPVTITSCLGPIVTGAPLDTSSVGQWHFTVATTDSNGVPASATVAYTVVPARPTLVARESARSWVERHRRGLKLPVGTTFSLSVDQSANVTLRIVRRVRGRIAGGRCVPSASKGRSCTRNLSAGSLPILAARAGSTTVAFSGRTSSGTLAPGAYTIVITAVGASGQSTVARLPFTVR